jgi:glucosamine-6-phosphate deaminase
MRLVIQPDYENLARWTASYIARKIELFKPTAEKPFVLGLPTGSSPLGVYNELISLYKLGKVSFKNVVTFNMDEYVGLAPDHPQSYHYFMWENLFSHVDIKRENVNILNGMAEDIKAECQRYEDKIAAMGGIDLFLGGIGIDGHIAFNEPGSSLTGRTRDKELNLDTRIANSRFFGNDIDRVPKLALTVGVGTVMDSREVVIIVNGHNKARALHHVVEGSISQMWTASAIQMHRRAMVVCDEAATYDLKVGTFKHFLDIEKENLDVASIWKSSFTW